ncbi:MAG: thiamine-phosphate kinase [Halothiobacillus sp.]
MNEFALIANYFKRPCLDAAVLLGVGDDCAVLRVPPNEVLLVSTDLLVAGRHFPESTPPFDIGYKALAVNLSDLAAMGARPLGATLGLALPDVDPAWLAAFAAGFYTLAAEHAVCLVGGDTVKSPQLTLAVTVMGRANPAQILRRSSAQSGDWIAVTGTVGDAGLGLRSILEPNSVPASLTPEELTFLHSRLNRPSPRLAEGHRLAEFAHAAIDISDGLLQDLQHILTASGVGAVIEQAKIPLSPAAQAWFQADPTAQILPLSAGDDYELLFTLHPQDWPQVDFPATVIGRIEVEPGLRVLDAEGQPLSLLPHGFDHFSPNRTSQP